MFREVDGSGKGINHWWPHELPVSRENPSLADLQSAKSGYLVSLGSPDLGLEL